MSASNPLTDLFGKKNEDPYVGKLTFTNKTISFIGNTLLLRNVSRFEKYGITYIPKISTAALILSAVLVIASLFMLPYGLLITIPFGLIVFIGIKERLRPKLYGLTIELNSGTSNTFLSKDKKGIEKLFDEITDIIENDRSVTYTFTNNGDIVMGNKYETTINHPHGPVAVGDQAESN